MHLMALFEGLSLGLANAQIWVSQLTHGALRGVIILLKGYACPQELACLEGTHGHKYHHTHGTLSGAVHRPADVPQLQARACTCCPLCTQDFLCVDTALCCVYGSCVNLFLSQGTKVCM